MPQRPYRGEHHHDWNCPHPLEPAIQGAMGMFDTIHLEAPLRCPVCGAEQQSLQTHAFEDVMAHLRIGSRVGGSVLSGIVSDTMWCSACYEAKQSSSSPVYLVIWHSVLAGVEQDLARAEARLASVDRLDLIGWLDQAQREEQRWKRRFYGLLSDVTRWHEHLDRQNHPEPPREGETAEQTARREAWRGLWSLADEILNAADPLAAIIEKNKPDPGDQDEW